MVTTRSQAKAQSVPIAQPQQPDHNHAQALYHFHPPEMTPPIEQPPKPTPPHTASSSSHLPNRALIFQSQLNSITPFTGVSSQDATRWLTHTANILRIQGFVDDTELPLLISGFLDGDALTWFQDQQATLRDWNAFRPAFLQRFPSPPLAHHPFESFQQLSQRRQGLAEPTIAYYTDVLKLCHQYNPNMPDPERVDHLKKGLRSSLLEKVLDRDPDTPDEFIEVVLKAESNQRILQAQLDLDSDLHTSSRHHYPAVGLLDPPPPDTITPPTYNSPLHQPQRFSARPPRRTPAPGSNIVCYTCGQPGHLSPHCHFSSTRPRDGRVLAVDNKSPSLTYIRVPVNRRCMRVLIDTGSSFSFIRSSALISLLHGPIRPHVTNLTLADGVTPFPVVGQVALSLNLKGIRTPVRCFVVRDLCCDCLLGTDWIHQNRVTLDFHHHRLIVRTPDRCTSIRLETDVENFSFPVHLIRATAIPPYTDIAVKARVPVSSSRHALFTPRSNLGINQRVDVPAAILAIKCYTTYVTISNPTNRPCHLAQNTRLGHFNPLRSAASLAPITRLMDVHHTTTTDSSTPPSTTLSTILDDLTQHLPQDNGNRTALHTVLAKYSSLFDTSTPKIADTTSVHTIRTGDALPQISRAYPQNHEQRAATDRIVETMLRSNQIRPSISPWSSPMLLARKKDNTYRFVVDYRKLNDVSTKDAYPMPSIDETLQRIGGHRFFTKIDLASGYFQIPIREEDKPKTAFTTGRALYEFNVLPQGLKNASASFQRIMNTLLVANRESFCIVYMDDILIFSDTFAQHLQHVDEILQVLHAHRFTANPPKCSIAHPTIDYLGHTISRHGVTPLNDNIAPIIDMPEPRTLKEANLFIGGSGFYRRFIKNFARLAAPILAVSNKSKERRAEFQWGEPQRSAFRALKTAITSKPLFLHFPAPNHPLILSTDASNNRIGGVLKQTAPDDSLHIISYFSRMLSETEQRYSTIEKEALAIHSALEKLRPFIVNHDLIIETDHCPLCNFHRRPTRNRRVDFWSIDLADYNIKEVKYKKGSCNCDADLLTRYPTIGSTAVITRARAKQLRPISPVAPPTPDTRPLPPTPLPLAAPSLSPLDPHRLRTEQRSDPAIQLSIANPDRFSLVRDGLLLRCRKHQPPVPVLPSSLIREVLHAFHDHASAAHFGRNRTYSRIAKRCFWPNMHRDIETYIRSCDLCSRHNIPRQRSPGHLQSIPPPTGVFDLVGLDFWGPTREPSTNLNRYVLVLTDYLSKFVIARAAPLNNAQTVAEFLLDVVTTFGVPHQLLTDQGRHFNNELIDRSPIEADGLQTHPVHRVPPSDQRPSRTMERDHAGAA